MVTFSNTTIENQADGNHRPDGRASADAGARRADGSIQWVALQRGLMVVGSPDRSWLHKLLPIGAADPFADPMTGNGDIASTRHLLDGALGAAQRFAVGAGSRPPLTLLRWVWRLAGYYHTTHATPPLMTEAAARFEAAGRTDLAAYAQEKVTDETGHDKLALVDLKSLGYPAEEVVRVLVPPTAKALVEYFESLVRGARPVSCIGYAYTLERLATSMGRNYIEQVEALIPKGVRATRCLRLHSGIGADVGHVDNAVAITARQPAEDRIHIVQAAYQTARIMFTVPDRGHLSEGELADKLAAFAP